MKQDSELLCVSANGKRIVFDPVNSHTATHFNDAPTLRAIAEELLSGMTLTGDLVARDVDMGRVIGDSESVPYWSRHAFAWGSQEIIPGSILTKRPW